MPAPSTPKTRCTSPVCCGQPPTALSASNWPATRVRSTPNTDRRRMRRNSRLVHDARGHSVILTSRSQLLPTYRARALPAWAPVLDSPSGWIHPEVRPWPGLFGVNVTPDLVSFESCRRAGGAKATEAVVTFRRRRGLRRPVGRPCPATPRRAWAPMTPARIRIEGSGADQRSRGSPAQRQACPTVTPRSRLA